MKSTNYEIYGHCIFFILSLLLVSWVCSPRYHYYEVRSVSNVSDFIQEVTGSHLRRDHEVSD